MGWLVRRSGSTEMVDNMGQEETPTKEALQERGEREYPKNTTF